MPVRKINGILLRPDWRRFGKRFSARIRMNYIS